MAEHEAGEPAPKVLPGRFYEDFDVGDVFRSRLGRTVTEADNVWFTCLTMNTNQIQAAKLHVLGTPARVKEPSPWTSS